MVSMEIPNVDWKENELIVIGNIKKYKPAIYKVFLIAIIADHTILNMFSQAWRQESPKLINGIQSKII